MASDNFDWIIVGGGIVGLATALAAREKFPGKRLLLLEKESEVGQHQSGHNSGVIHSGIYYKPGSRKAATCVAGAAAMIEFCARHEIPFDRCGKVIVATSEAEKPRLEEILRRGHANGVGGVSMLTAEQIREIEPHCAGLQGVHVPGAAITDYRQVTRKLAELVRERGGEVRLGAEVRALAQADGGIRAETTAGDFAGKLVVNCAGLHSDRVARMLPAAAPGEVIISPFRGEYYELSAASAKLVRGLIYPVPDPAFPFLGVHFTKKLGGGVEAGPNAVLAGKREGYRKRDVSAGDLFTTLSFPGFWRMAGRYWREGLAEYWRSLSKRAFVRSLQRLVPEVRAEDLQAGGAGVRAQALDRQGRLLDDFYIVRTQNFVHVGNVPSPAATASLVIGRQIAELASSE